MILVLVTICTAQSKLIIDLSDPNLARMPIAIPDFISDSRTSVNGRDVAMILRNDLYLTGLFHIVETAPSVGRTPNGAPDFQAWSRSGAQALVMGNLTVRGNELILEARLYDTALRKLEMGKRLIGTIGNLRQMVHKLGDRVMGQLTGVPGCFSTGIAFVRASRPKELFTMDFDGHNLRQVTRTGCINLSPEWAPNGRSLLFTSYLNRNPDLWSLDLHTLRPHAVSTRRGINAAARYSPDGKMIALSLSPKGIPKIFLVTPQGNIIKQLTFGRGNDISPTWSPDRSTIAYVSDQAGSPHVYLAPVGGGRAKKLTSQSAYNTDPDWSPRGDLLAFTARIDGRFQICTIRPDGTDFRVLTSEGSNRSPAWSPDGRMIAFSSDRRHGRRIYLMDLRGQIQTPVSPILGQSPAWSRSLR